MTYYLERRDPAFESKMREVLLVYQEVRLHNQQLDQGAPLPPVITVAVDEKPGLQAIATTSPDLPPVPGHHSTLARDYEYKRLGTGSILAALDLHTGHVTARVERRHQPGVYRVAEGPGCLLSRRLHHPAHSGQSFGPCFERNSGVLSHPSQPFQICSHPYPRVLAQSGGNLVRQNGPYLPPTPSRAILGRIARSHSQGNRRNECRSSRTSLDKVRCT